MKRIVLIVAAALLCQAAIVFAQDSGEPSTQSVLDAARAKYWQDKAPDAAPDAVPSQDAVPYTPILISFVPGLSLPFGYYDVSLAGGAIGNLVHDVSGIEVAGVFNVARDIRGIQGAGVFNIARGVLGFQHAGVFNMARGKVSGIQAAGVFNIAGRVVGGQAAGVFNRADTITGIQVGLINVARHIDGVQLGLINIAGNGVDSFGLTYEPASDYFYAHWQAGTPAFFTVAGIGAPSGAWFHDISQFELSFGAGSRTRVFGFNLDLDVSAVQSLAGLPSDPSGWQDFDWSTRDRFWPYPSVRLTAGLPLSRHFQLVAGLKADFDVDAWGDRVPEALRVGSSWQGKLFDESFTVWPKWFFGVKI